MQHNINSIMLFFLGISLKISENSWTVTLKPKKKLDEMENMKGKN